MTLFQKYTAHFPDQDRELEVAHDGEEFLVRVPRGSVPGGEPASAVATGTSGASPAAMDAGAAANTEGLTRISWDEQECGRILLRVDGRPVECRISRLPDGTMKIEWRGRQVPVRVADDLSERARLAHAHHGGPVPLRSPMPGTVVKLLVAEGEMVLLEQPLLIVEAMKMQNELASPLAGRIVNLSVKAGQAVEGDQILLEIRP